MSVAAKVRHIEIFIEERRSRKYTLPSDKLKGLLVLLDDYRDEDSESVSVDEALKETYAETGKPATHLRGFRLRDNLTQAQLAKKIGTTQSAIASMESGRRSIGKATAKKLAEVFDTAYRAFL